MQITEVRIYRSKNDNGGKFAAYASVTFEGSLVVRNFKVFRGEEGLVVTFPSRKGGEDGKYYDTVFSLKRELREAICQRVLDEYNAAAA